MDEIKFLLCHLLLQYNIKYGEDSPPLPYMSSGGTASPNSAKSSDSRDSMSEEIRPLVKKRGGLLAFLFFFPLS